MKKLESNLKLYVQPETEVLELKFQTSLLGSSGQFCATEECTEEICTDECGDECFDDE